MWKILLLVCYKDVSMLNMLSKLLWNPLNKQKNRTKVLRFNFGFYLMIKRNSSKLSTLMLLYEP